MICAAAEKLQLFLSVQNIMGIMTRRRKTGFYLSNGFLLLIVINIQSTSCLTLPKTSLISSAASRGCTDVAGTSHIENGTFDDGTFWFRCERIKMALTTITGSNSRSLSPSFSSISLLKVRIRGCVGTDGKYYGNGEEFRRGNFFHQCVQSNDTDVVLMRVIGCVTPEGNRVSAPSSFLPGIAPSFRDACYGNELPLQTCEFNFRGTITKLRAGCFYVPPKNSSGSVYFACWKPEYDFNSAQATFSTSSNDMYKLRNDSFCFETRSPNATEIATLRGIYKIRPNVAQFQTTPATTGTAGGAVSIQTIAAAASGDFKNRLDRIRGMAPKPPSLG